MLRILTTMLAAAVWGGNAIELTTDSWESAVGGKTVFVKFFAPWCGHCKSIKPDWDKLMKEFASSSTVLVADVDCTAGGKDLCDKMGVKGFPTLKHGDPSDLQDYKGGRDLQSLKKFASGLGPSCSPANIDLCDDEKKTKIAEFVALGADAREEQITANEAKASKMESDFKLFVEGLQKSYEEANTKKDKAIADLKANGAGLLKAVHAHAKKAKSEL